MITKLIIFIIKTALIGSTIAIYIWFVNPSNPNSTYRLNDSSYIHFKSMLISLMNQLLLLMFELLCCDKVNNFYK